MKDEHDKRKAQIENEMISQAEDSAKECQTCKHWGDPCCDAINLHTCDHPKTFGNDSDSMTVADGDPLNGGVFVTGPHFGCVRWDRKT